MHSIIVLIYFKKKENVRKLNTIGSSTGILRK